MPKQRRRAKAPVAGSGRGLNLHRVVARTDDGEPITVADTVLDWLARGHPRNVALAHAGISTSTFNEWLRAAARASATVQANPAAKLTANERALIDFHERVEHATALGEGKHWKTIDDLATGGLSKTTVVIKTYPDGTTEQIQRAERLPPSFQAAKFMLESVYGRITPLDIRVADALTDDEALGHFADAMERWLDNNNNPAIEVNGHEVNGNGTNGHR